MEDKELRERYPDNRLNLEILAEEAAEICHIKSKVIRFGSLDIYGPKGETNKERLTEEVGHILAVIDILIAHGVIMGEHLKRHKVAKFDKLDCYYNYKGPDDL